MTVSANIGATQYEDVYRWELTDGWGEVDDTLRVTVLADDRPDGTTLSLTVDDTSFGFYDVETSDGIVSLGEYTVFGRADRRFEDTVFANIRSLAGQAEALLSSSPFGGWGGTIVADKLKILLASASSEGDVRRQLERYGLTVAPQRGFVGRGVVVQPRYPTAGGPKTIDAELVVHGSRYSVPDDFNRPGRYAARPIVAGYRAPETGVVSVLVSPQGANPYAGDRVRLDVQKTAEEPAGFVANVKRWELQNTAAFTQATLTEADFSIHANDLITFAPYDECGLPTFTGGSETWRVVKAVHRGEGLASDTRLDLALWQGLPG